MNAKKAKRLRKISPRPDIRCSCGMRPALPSLSLRHKAYITSRHYIGFTIWLPRTSKAGVPYVRPVPGVMPCRAMDKPPEAEPTGGVSL